MTTLAQHIRVRPRYMRSVNLERDLDAPGSLEGYIPTPRARDMLGRILDAYAAPRTPTCWTITGVYGTGKSAFANFVAAALGPRGSNARDYALAALRTTEGASLNRKLGRIIPTAGLVRAVTVARREPVSTAVIRAVGDAAERFWANRQGPKPACVHTILRMREQVRAGESIDSENLHELVRDIATASGVGVLLIIDELGKLLEYAASSNSTADLYLLQQLAEVQCVPGSPVVLIGLLHQAFAEYGTLLTTAERAEWEKIQGRFEDVPFADSADQMLRLVSEAIECSLPKGPSAQLRRSAAAWQRHFNQIDVPIASESLSADRIRAVFPLHPVAALVLPLLCTRFGQNDRTLFTFLAGTGPDTLQAFAQQARLVEDEALPTLRLHQLYDYFMVAFNGGGTQQARVHRWAEIHSVIAESAGGDAEHLEALKTIGVLNLVGSAGPVRASRHLVVSALVRQPDAPAEHTRWEKVVEGLVERRMVTYRHQVDEYRIWQGSDFDIEGAVERRSAAERRSIAQVLSELYPLPPIVAQRHSYETGTLRFFERVFLGDESTLDAIRTRNRASDGTIVYWIAGKQATSVPAATLDGKPLVVLEIDPSRSLAAAAQELAALIAVENEEVALQADGVARRELTHRIRQARDVLEHSISPMLAGGQAREIWYGGSVGSAVRLNARLSDLCDEVYSRGPVLWNELINRRELTSQGARAQRELIAALLTNGALPRLGMEGTGPEVSMYDSVLAATGVHRYQDGEWIIAPPSAGGIGPVWEAVERFCMAASDRPRPVDELYAELESPPFGVKRGLIPVILAVVLVYHAENLSLYLDGSYLPVVAGHHFELLVKDPGRFAAKYFEISGVRWEVFKELEAMLRSRGVSRPRVARNATLLTVVSPLVRFATSLPPITQASEDLSAKAKAVQAALVETREPDRLLFDTLPIALGLEPFASDEVNTTKRHETFRRALLLALRELQQHYDGVLHRCHERLREAFGVTADVDRLREDLRVRASYLSGKVIEPRLRSVIGVALDDRAGDREWLESILMVIADKPVASWSSDDQIAFELNLAELARRFANLEALQKDSVRDGREGFAARRVTLTEPGGHEISRLIWIDSDTRAIVEAHANRLAGEIKDLRITENQQHAILMALLERLVGSLDRDAPRADPLSKGAQNSA
jgi:hypothetical protein